MSTLKKQFSVFSDLFRYQLILQGPLGPEFEFGLLVENGFHILSTRIYLRSFMMKHVGQYLNPCDVL